MLVQLKLRHMMPSGELGARLTDRNWAWGYNFKSKVRGGPLCSSACWWALTDLMMG